MPSADFSTVFSADCSTPSFACEAPERPPGVRHVTVTARTPNLQSASLPQMEDFAVTCPLVPDAPRLISGSCSSSRSFGFGFLQTPPRDDALAVSLAFGSAKTWLPDFHRHSYVPSVFFKIVDTFFSRNLQFFAVDVLLPIWVQEHASDSRTVSYVSASPS